MYKITQRKDINKEDIKKSVGNGTLLIVAVLCIAVVGYLYLGGYLQTGMGRGASAASYSGGGIAPAASHSGGGTQTGASGGGKQTSGTGPTQGNGLAYLLIAPALVGLGGAISKKKWGTYSIFSLKYRLIELTAEPPKLEFRDKEATTHLTVKFNREQQRGKPVEFRIADTHGNPVHACLFRQGEQTNGQEKLEVTGTQTDESVQAQLKASGDENMAVQVCATVKQWGLGKGPHACITLSKEGMAASETGRPQIVIKLQAQDTPVEIVAADNKHAKALLAKIKKETGMSSPILVAKTTSDKVTAGISLQHGNIRIPPDKYRLKVADVKPNQDGTYTLQGSGMYVIRARYKGTNLKQALYLMKTEKKGSHRTKQDAPAGSGDADKKQQETTAGGNTTETGAHERYEITVTPENPSCTAGGTMQFSVEVSQPNLKTIEFHHIKGSKEIKHAKKARTWRDRLRGAVKNELKNVHKGENKIKIVATLEDGTVLEKMLTITGVDENSRVPTEEPEKDGVTFMAVLFDGKKALATAEPSLYYVEGCQYLLCATVSAGMKLTLWVHANKANKSLTLKEYTVALRSMEDEQEIIPTKHEKALVAYEIEAKDGERKYRLNATHGEQQYACLVSITGKGLVKESEHPEGQDELKSLFDGNQATLVFKTSPNTIPKDWSEDKKRELTIKDVVLLAEIKSDVKLPAFRLELQKNGTKLESMDGNLDTQGFDTLQEGVATRYTALVYGKGQLPATYSEIELTLKEGKEEKNAVKGTFTLKVGEEQTIIDPAAPPKPVVGEGGLHTVALRKGDTVPVSLEFSGTGKYYATLRADGKDKPLAKKGNAYECTLTEEDLGNKENNTFALSVYEQKTRYWALPTKKRILTVDSAIYLKKHQAKRNRKG